jgi:uncharacterized repeat protein (TIGR01451 family)
LVLDVDGVYRVRLEVQVDPFGVNPLLVFDETGPTGPGRSGEWQINNCAQLSCQAPGEAGQAIYSDCAGTGIQRPLLGIEKSLRSIKAEPGREAQFEIVVTNLSDVTAYTITLEDRMPTGFTYVEDSVKSLDTLLIGLDDIQPLIWGLEDLEPKQSIRLTYTVFIDSKVRDDVYTTTVKAHAMDLAGFPFESNEFIYDFRVERAMLVELNQRIAPSEGTIQILAGKTMTIITELNNVGSDALQEGSLHITLPDGVRYIAGSSRLNNTALPDPESVGTDVSWRIGELPVKGRMMLQYSVRSAEPLLQQREIETKLEGISTTGEAYRSGIYRLPLK